MLHPHMLMSVMTGVTLQLVTLKAIVSVCHPPFQARRAISDTTSRVFCISRPVARNFSVQLGIISVHVVFDPVLGEYLTDWHAVYGEEKRTKNGFLGHTAFKPLVARDYIADFDRQRSV